MRSTGRPHLSKLTHAAAVAAAAILCVPAAASASDLHGAVKRARAPSPELRVTRNIDLPTSSTDVVRLEQRVGGVPVIDGDAVAVDPAGAAPKLVADDTHAAIDNPPPPSITSARAIAAARAATHLGPPAVAPTAELAIQPGNGGTLVWRIELDSDHPPAAYEVLVDAASGQIVERRSLLENANGKAKLFDPNPVVAHGKFKGLHNNHDRNTPLLTALRRPVQLVRLDPHQSCLVGQFAKVTTKQRPKAKSTAVCAKHRNFNRAKRADPDFEALMAYYHIDRTRAYVTSLDVGHFTHARTRVFADQFKEDNSFFDPIRRDIRYGRGGVDDAEDGDVVTHEYGHAIEDAQVHNFGDGAEGGALSEGWGDYTAAMMSAQTPGTSYENDVCIFEWDSISYDPFGTCDRRADETQTLQQGQAECTPHRHGVPIGEPEIHCTGQVWSSTLFALRTELGNDAAGRSVLDRVVLTSNFMLPRAPSFAQAGQALLDADAALYPDASSPGHGIHDAAIRAELKARGILS
jgi:Fungalysin metallopeptidase (M36)/Peptidase propeptide and YPEB domain